MFFSKCIFGSFGQLAVQTIQFWGYIGRTTFGRVLGSNFLAGHLRYMVNLFLSDELKNKHANANLGEIDLKCPKNAEKMHFSPAPISSQQILI